MSRSQPPATTGRHGDTQGVVEEIRKDALDAWNADTIDEVLRRGERADTSTPEDEFRRCPECLSRKVISKKATVEQSNQRPEPYKCGSNACVEHFETPLPPKADFDADDPGCPECGSRRLANASGAAAAWTCLDCPWTGDSAAEEPPESNIPMSDDRTDAFDWCTDELAEPADRPPLGEFRDERLADLVVELYDETDASYRDLANVVPYSRAWVGRRVRGEA